MKKMMIIMCLCCVVALGAVQAQAATLRIVDSSQQDLSAINAVSGMSVVSVGTIIVWGTSNDPYDADKWLECDGSAFSVATYPDLANIYPSLRVPDYRDQFVRGGAVAQVGQVAADSTRSHAHQIDQHSHTVSGSAGKQSYSAPASGGGSGYYFIVPNAGGRGVTIHPSGSGIGGGVYKSTYSWGGTEAGWEDTYYLPIGGGASTSAHTSGGSITGITDKGGPTTTYASGSSETAPQHIRVRYLIRALP